MSASQWTILHSDAANTHSLSTSPDIEGISNLRFRHNGDGSTPSSGLAAFTSGAAVTSGKIRSIVRFENNLMQLGLFGMLQTALVIGSSAYWVVFDFANPTLVYLKKVAVASLHDVGGGLLTAGVSNGISGGLLLGTNYALQLKFQLDTDSGFVLLTCSVAPTAVASPDNYLFDDLVDKIIFTDSTSPYSAGVSMGVGMRCTNSNQNIGGDFDLTQGFEV